MKTIVDNYLYTFNLPGIHNKTLLDNCLIIDAILEHTFPANLNNNQYGDAVLTTHKHSCYNLFTFPTTELVKLYNELRTNIVPLLDKETTYVLKAWLNVYHKGQGLRPHGHWRREVQAWHGFYCVNVGENESATIYSIPGIEHEVTVTSENGLLVIGKSDNDRHRTTIWENDTMPRITIAFDIVPVQYANPNQNTDMEGLFLFHFIPFK